MEGKETSFGSLKKMAKGKEKTSIGRRNDGITTIADLGEDLMRNVLQRLPALTFTAASCVSHDWNRLCNSILFSCPKLSSAVSFESSLQDAVTDVVEKVLSAPIRPHFALVSMAPKFNLQEALDLISWKLGSKTPVIVNVSEGVIGRLADADQLVELQWEVAYTVADDRVIDLDPLLQEEDSENCIILTVGCLPGLKAHIVPLLKHRESPVVFIDKFIKDIRESTLSVSDSGSPAGIILYAGKDTNIKPVLQTMEYAFPLDTFVVGDGGSFFLYRSDGANIIERRPDTANAGVALVFSRDRNTPVGIGQTEFHVLLSPGLRPIGPTYRAVSVKTNDDTSWLTASKVGILPHQNLDGEAMLEEIYDVLGDEIQFPVFYIGVEKRRKCSLGTEKPERIYFLEFHQISQGNEEYLYVNSIGIKTGDPFRFYVVDSNAALSSSKRVSDCLRDLKLSLDKSNGKVFGGMVFACCGRGESFFGPNVDSASFTDNFPGIPFAGTYCDGEICRATSMFYEDADSDGPLFCSQHAYSAAYLVMSYRPPPQSEAASTSGVMKVRCGNVKVGLGFML